MSALWHIAIPFLDRAWAQILRIALVIWVCRVSALSVALGAATIVGTTQAQDLFLDMPGDYETSVTHWVSFYVLLLALWVAPVHLSARRILQVDYGLIYRQDDAHFKRQGETYGPIMKAVPRALGSLCIVSVFLGQLGALRNLPGCGNDPAFCRLIERAQDQLGFLLGATAAVFILYLFLIRNGGLFVRLIFGWRMAVARGSGGSRFGYFFMPFFAGDAVRNRAKSPVPCQSEYAERPPVRAVVFLIASAVVPLIVLSGPIAVAEIFPRAQLLMIILGGWIPVCSILAHWSHMRRAPLLAGAVAIIGLVTGLVGDNHDIRRTSDARATAQIDLRDAVDRWKAINGWDPNDAPEKRPRPIIVATAGGASRAAFFTGSVLGALRDSDVGREEGHAFKTGLFAISGVSGGSLGAATYAAIAYPVGHDDAAVGEPSSALALCRAGASELWFASERTGAEASEAGFKDCLQAILSGDFLSPVAAAFAFHDVLRFLPFGDRASILECSWERRFLRFTEASYSPIGWCHNDGPRGLARPFSDFSPASGEAWRPLLLLNGTSGETGKRLITSHLALRMRQRDMRDVHKRSGASDPIFVDSYDLYALFEDARPRNDFVERLDCLMAGVWGDPDVAGRRDISLSTAVTSSARFPFLTPAGNVRNAACQIVDRVIDGGYFESFGALTALDLVRALEEIDSRLRPFVLQISSDPDLVITSGGVFLPDANDGAVFSGLLAPLGGLFVTQSARGSHANELLKRELKSQSDEKNLCGNYAHVRLYSDRKENGMPKQVSMSWWLSKPVQQYLDAQLGLAENQQELMKLYTSALGRRGEGMTLRYC